MKKKSILTLSAFKRISRASIIALLLLTMWLTVAKGQYDSKRATLDIDLTRPSDAPSTPIWTFFGYDEANYTYMKDGRKLLAELAQLSPVPVFIRTHNLLTTGNGIPALKWSSTNVYTETAKGESIYNWKLTDSIFDTYEHLGMKPLVEVSFMPEALSAKPESDGYQTTPDGKKVFHYTGWNYPPADYHKFARLIYQWVQHCIARYGRSEVLNWYWEIWNEPDISYWKGSIEEYCKLYDYSADAIKRALPGAKVGGPETTNPGGENAAVFLRKFLDHVTSGINAATGKPGIPLDFVTFHAKGDPKTIDGTVWMNMGRQLDNIDKGFDIIKSFPAICNLPVIIGESDPEGCAACPEDLFPQNAYRNGTMYAVYIAELVAREYDLAARANINLAGAVTWGFEFENQPWFRGFRDLATNGIDKPVLNTFRMLGMMKGKAVTVRSSSPYPLQTEVDSSVRKKAPEINGLATVSRNSAYLMCWNYHDKNDITANATKVNLNIQGIDAVKIRITEYLIDQAHSNSFTAWKKMNSPQNPTAREYHALELAGHLYQSGKVQSMKIHTRQLRLAVNLQPQAITLFKITW